MQIQALIAEEVVVGGGVEEFNAESHIEIARLSIFSKEVEKIRGFIMVCRLYLRMKMREAPLKEKIQWILSYIQGESVDVWKENILEDLEGGVLEYETVGEFLTNMKKEFGGEDKKTVKIVELRKME